MESHSYHRPAQTASHSHDWAAAYEARVQILAQHCAETERENEQLRRRLARLEAHSHPRPSPLTWLRGWVATLLDEVAL